MFMNKLLTGKIFSFLILMLCCASVAIGQGSYNTTTWKFSNPKQFGFTVFDVDFFDNNNVIAVGADGGIAKSTDGGANWTYGGFTYVNNVGLTTKATFYDVHYITANIAYAVGTGGCVAKTTDGGTTWSLVNNPLFANNRIINTCWFIDQNKGYIAGQWNTADSIPKVYVTNNGGATWDSLATPAINGTTKVGFVNNATYPATDFPITGKAKEIYRIQFSSNNIGYVTGGGSSLFPNLGIPNITSTTTCAFTSTQTTGSHNASLLWKFDNGTLVDYSLSKERLGYLGYNPTVALNCTSKFGTVNQSVQLYRAFNIINDSMVVLMSSNNNVVVRVRTGRNDSTPNINKPGFFEKGKFEVLNTGPSGAPAGYPAIPAVQVLNASNPYVLVRASNGKLFASSGSSNFAPANRMWTSVDTGRNWVEERNLPTGRTYSTATNWAIDIAPNGKFIALGNNGVVSDSIPGGSWQSNYISNPVAVAHLAADFADCNNGILAGSSSITVTEDGGATWQNKARADFANSNYSINGIAYPTLTKSYFAVSNGVLYFSADKGTTLDPLYSNFDYQMQGVATVGDSIWAIGYSAFSVPAASRTSAIFRSFNAGATWQVIGGFPVNTLNEQLSKIAFPSKNIGYIAGARNAVYKTTDAGSTWTKISPFPSLNDGPTGFPNARITYQEIQAIDDNTVFLIGNMFTNTGVKRVYRTTDGGATWVDITGNLAVLLPVGNIVGMTWHDANNGYVAAGSALFRTTDGGANWTMDIAPTNSIFETMAFAPRKVPAGITFANRKLFVTGIAAPTANGSIMEYGNPLNINVNFTQTVVNATCTAPNGGSITVTASGGLPPYQYSINGGAFQSSNVFSGLNQGAKTITVKDAFCGVLTKTVTVGFTDNLTLTTTPNTETTVCAGVPVQLTATSAATNYSWTPSLGVSSTTINNPTVTINSTNTYTVTATLNGCVRTSTVRVFVNQNPIVSAGPDKTIVEGDAVTLNGASNNSASIVWSPSATLTGFNSFTPVAKPSTTTTYTLTVRDNNNCVGSDNTIVTVVPVCLKVMDAFTPNGDGTNDRWLVTTSAPCTSNMSVNVYNRYGNIVYKNGSYQNNWDGTYNGKPVPDGTYYYNIVYTLINGNQITLKGDVTILR
jgi:gliding motility-associated-like protein